jgi:predicted kinase
MRRINIMSGLPGSGKTTYVKYHAKEDDIVLHRDDWRATIRAELNTDKYFPVSATEEWTRWMCTIHAAMSSPCDIWIDQTTIGTGALAKLLNGINPSSADFLVIHLFDLPFGTICERNNTREGDPMRHVPQSIMDSMWETHHNKRPIHEDAVRELQPPCRFTIIKVTA